MADYYCERKDDHPLHRQHHDEEHGFRPESDAAYLERLAWEIFQPGLSWLIVLKKRQGLRRAFRQFDLQAVAAMGEKEIETLLDDPSIIRHARKIRAVINNANQMQDIVESSGSFEQWIMPVLLQGEHHAEQVLIKQFNFVGRSVAREFLMATGLVAGAHHKDCPIYTLTIEKNPLWISCKYPNG